MANEENEINEGQTPLDPTAMTEQQAVPQPDGTAQPDQIAATDTPDSSDEPAAEDAPEAVPSASESVVEPMVQTADEPVAQSAEPTEDVLTPATAEVSFPPGR